MMLFICSVEAPLLPLKEPESEEGTDSEYPSIAHL